MSRLILCTPLDPLLTGSVVEIELAAVHLDERAAVADGLGRLAVGAEAVERRVARELVVNDLSCLVLSNHVESSLFSVDL